PEQVIVRQSGAEGFAVAEDHGYLAALRTELTDALILEGLAREVVRHIQTMRKEADFDLSDHIAVTYQASGSLVQVMSDFAEYIQGETLADVWQAGSVETDAASLEIDGANLA